MKKIWLMLIMLVLVGCASDQAAQRKELEVQSFIEKQNLLCQTLERENSEILARLDYVLDRLRPEQRSYKKVKQKRDIAQKAADLIEKNKKQLEEISRQLKKSASHLDREILIENLQKTTNNLILISLDHRYLNNFLWAIFAPLFGQEPPPPETPI